MKHKLSIVLLLLLFLAGCAAAPGQPLPSSTAPVTEAPVTKPPSYFEVHYLDVGQADATLIVCDGEYLLLDGGDTSDSSLLYAYLKNLGADRLRYVICSHVHRDHIGGLAGALNYASADTVFCPTREYDSDEFRNLRKYLTCPITVPSAGDVFSLGSAECSILAVNTQPDHPNNSSIVLKIRYGDTSFLFSADAEQAVEQFILDAGKDISCTVLKVPHHGSDTSLSDAWLSAARPQYAVISCGKDNAYSHPAPSTLEKLQGLGIPVYRTDLHGHIILRSNGRDVTVEVQKNSQADPFVPPQGPLPPDTLSPAQDYVLNHNTEVFHHPNCTSADKILEKNREDVTASREELIARGFSPCGNCHP